MLVYQRVQDFKKKCEKVEEVHRIQSMQSRSPLTEDEKSPMFFHTVEILRYFLMWFVFFLVGWKDIFLSLLRSNHQRYKLFTACRMLYIFVFFLNSLQFHTFGISAIAILDKQILSVFFLQATEWVFYLIWFCWYWLGLSPSHKCQSKNIWLDHFKTRGPCQILSSSKKSRIWALI